MTTRYLGTRRIPDLTGGLCIGDQGWLDAPHADRLDVCAVCPVRDRCAWREPEEPPNPCPNGHDRRDVGTDSRGKCTECRADAQRRYRAKRGAA